MPVPWPETEEESEAKRPRVLEDYSRSRESRRSIQSAGGICWSSSDLALAAKLLETPNARFPTITFSNLEEKRRVFTLVYDVLRYKSVLNQALNDVYFFTRYSYLKERCHLVWLLFLDLYKRDFTPRDPLEPEVEAAFQAQGLFEIDEVLWQLRVKLAATVSRLRIKSGAHSLSNLLPNHLQVTRSALEENIVSGWVNIFKTSLKDTCTQLDSCGFKTLARDREVLEPLTYKTDHLLPRFLHIMPNVREDLVESPLVQDHHIVMQERTFCLGPAIMAQLLKNHALSGKVAQTHINSPITMAYFANLLINNDKIESLLVFGAGYRKEACEQYLKGLGVKNAHVFSENFASLSPESRVLDNVIAVLATPPNTNSSVVDPVDLAVARGGDLQILQQLTNDDFASAPQGDNINKFLRDQRDTLRRGMSKPQIQFIVYETHSRFHCENEEMANNLVNELNNYAREVHLEEMRRAQGETQERERREQTEVSEASADVPSIKVDEELSLPLPSPTQSIQIPPSDLFEIADIPDLCPNLDNCLDLVSEGTYIAVIKRKEITRLDPKYMIQMAEARGLFGRPDATPKAKTAGQTARAKAALAALQARSDSFEKSKTKVKYTFPDPISRKTFLTAKEEEELIRRLYICPRLHVYPTKLYESGVGLPSLETPADITIPGFVHAFIASLSVIIVSEIGDKTFFIAAIMAMKHSRLTVFLGAISALVLMTILSVLFGWLATVIPRNIVYYISTALFAIFGIKMLWEGYHMPPGGAQEEMEEVHADLRKRDDEIEKEVHMMNTDPESGRRRRQNILKVVSRIFLQAFTLTFLAEWGDRSQLTTIVLAAREDIYGVMFGGVVGHSLCTGLAVLGGRFVAQRISVRTVTIIGGVVFIVFALSALVFNPLSDDKPES